MRRMTSALLVLAVALTGSWGVAAAEPEAPPAAVPAVALLTLTTMPGGWESRTDLRPTLEVYPDGRAIKAPDAAAADRAPATPPQRLNGSIPSDVLNASLAEIKELSVVDLGMPTATDQGSQIIDVMPPEQDQDVHLIMYAPELTDGLSTEQRAARQRFVDLYHTLVDSFVQN
ncbi:hypothetical protein ACLMAJ_21655 [Nocardia sp. KC 131]|uniref:hypothetical protein n=1 Tax=Nocardia arseniciresistens TaxID=3392119 RepID=UPI00398E6557